MKRSMIAVLSILVLGIATTSFATVTLDVYASSAPNAFGSPSWGGYVVNALNSLENGLGNIGEHFTTLTEKISQ